MNKKEKQIFSYDTLIRKSDRENLLKQKACVLWFTGLSGSGKSTIANKVEEKLYQLGKLTYLLDGDNIRKGLNSDLGFSEADRVENMRRIGEVARLFADSGVITLTAFISPFLKEREKVRSLFPNDEFVEIYVKCSLKECELRDPKGLYKKARKGEIGEFTGISSPYEEPIQPEILLDTEKMSIDECANVVIQYLKEGDYL